MKCGVFFTTRSIKSGCGGLIGHETGETIAFWFRTREQGNLDRLLKPLNTGNVYTELNCKENNNYSAICG
jgi:hypothetical protein